MSIDFCQYVYTGIIYTAILNTYADGNGKPNNIFFAWNT